MRLFNRLEFCLCWNCKRLTVHCIACPWESSPQVIGLFSRGTTRCLYSTIIGSINRLRWQFDLVGYKNICWFHLSIIANIHRDWRCFWMRGKIPYMRCGPSQVLWRRVRRWGGPWLSFRRGCFWRYWDRLNYLRLGNVSFSDDWLPQG